MKKTLITTSIILALSTTVALTPTSVSAKQPSKQQAIYQKPTVIGLGSGLVAGSLIAGPVGAMVAGTIGLLIGNAEEIDDDRQAALANLKDNQTQLNAINSQKQQLINNLNQIEQQNHLLSEQLSLANNTINSREALEKIKLNLQFKVNSSEVESFYQDQVQQLALLVQENPELKVHLSGFADRNGDEEHNLTLSANRVASVKALLIAQGVDENTIVTAALGESSPMQTQQDYQNDFYDRRVEIKLLPQQGLTAGN